MRFIVFEGLDGAGKSTLIQAIMTHLQREKIAYDLVRDPGTTSLGEKLRSLILDPNEKPSAKTEVLMYQASRAQLVSERIAPALTQGKWVLSDRFASSTVSFQAWARGQHLEEIEWLNRYACDGVKPDMIIYIDITVAESQKRQENRNQKTGSVPDRMEKEKVEFHEKVRAGYLKQAQQAPQSWLVLDGMKTPEQLLADVIQSFKEKQWLV